MKRVHSIIILLTIFTTYSFAQPQANTCKKIDKFLYLITKLHHQAPYLDKRFANRAVENAIFYLDGQCHFFYD